MSRMTTVSSWTGGDSARRHAVGRTLRTASYEILPFGNIEEQVLEHVPVDVSLTVTVTEKRGTAPTVELAARLAEHGYRVAPHLAARLIRDEAHLTDLVARLREAGVDEVFVIGGDAAEPAGGFTDALSLLRALEETGHHFRTVGIGGYPEGHGTLGTTVVERALDLKASHATRIVTQLCFDAASTVRWAQATRDRGVRLPIRVGVPGALSRQKLIRISARLGLGPSARFLQKQQNLLWRFFLPGGYSPDRLLSRLAPSLEKADNDLEGIHVFTFNELASTEAWRQSGLAALAMETGAEVGRP